MSLFEYKKQHVWDSVSDCVADSFFYIYFFLIKKKNIVCCKPFLRFQDFPIQVDACMPKVTAQRC